MSVPQTGNNADSILTGSSRSVEFDGVDDFLKLPTTQGGLGNRNIIRRYWRRNC